MSLTFKLSLLSLVFFLLCSVGAQSQVNLPYGKAEATVPVLDYVGNDGIPVKVSLDYTSGNGIRMNEFASNVGLGWSLRAGGSITRVMADKPDDVKLNGYLYTTVTPSNAITKDKGVSLILPCNVRAVVYPDPGYHADREMDLFEFDFNGRTGSFRIGRDGVPFTTMDSKIKITYEQSDMTGVSTRIHKFTITTEDGLQYVFDKLDLEDEYEYVYQASACSGTVMTVINWGTTSDPFNYGKKTGKAMVRSWKLTKIINPFSGKEAQFEYATWTVDYIQTRYYYKTANYNPDLSPRDVDYRRQGARYSGTSNQIARIVLPDQRTVEFIYDTNERVDLPGMKALQTIKLNGDASQYKLKYRYFKSGGIYDYTAAIPELDKEKVRLMLQSVQVHNFSDLPMAPPYSFTYKGESTLRLLPGRFALEIDHWGYYNGRTSNYQRVFDYATNRVPANDGTDYIYMSMLDVIKYPAGNSLQFDYEANKSLLPDGVTAITYAGARVKKTTRYDGINHAQDIVSEYRYELENGYSSGWGYEVPEYTQRMNVYMLRPNSGNWWTENIQPVTPILGVFGVIISAIIDLFTPDYVEDTFITDAYNMLPVNSANLMPAMYSRVEVLEGSAADNIGKKVYEFTSIHDVPAVHAESRTILDSRQRFYSWAYGLPKKSAVYNKAGQLVKTAVYEYRMLNSEKTGANFVNSSHRVKKMVVVPTTQYNPYYVSLVEINQPVYYPLTGRAELARSTERLYDLQSGYSETSTAYQYNSNLNISETVTQNSRGDIITKAFRYPDFYGQNTTYANWVNQNYINTPIYTEEWQTPAGSATEQLVAANAILLGNVGAGGIKPLSVYHYASTTPTASGSIFYSLSSPLPISPAFKLGAQYSYSSTGSQHQVIQDGRIISKIFDNTGMRTIATAVNAVASDIAYSSFESGQMDSWAIVPSSIFSIPVLSWPNAPTGSIVANMADIQHLQKTGLNASKTYVVTCWISGSAPLTITEGTKSDYKELLTVGNWKLVSVKVTGTTVVSVHTSFSGLLDELRLVPEDAYMETACYRPGGNVSATCNVAHDITRFEYDAAARLVAVKDLRGNTVKSYCYDIAGMPVNCRQLWYNTAYSQQFSRNNCPAGNITSPVTYTVAAGKHASQISQADADAKAVADAAANGQNYANQQGVCSNTVYARLHGENEIWDPTSGYGDVVVSFYADAAGTLPVSVSNLTINVRKKVVDTENGNYIDDTSAVAMGTDFLFDYSVVLYLEYESGATMSVTYSLLPGTGYTIIQ